MIAKNISKLFAGFVVALVAFGMIGAGTASAITEADLVAAGFTSQQAAIVLGLLGGSSASVTTSAYTHTGTLAQGANGSKVMELQAALNSVQNPDIVVDGAFGPATKAAVMQFQASNGLTTDGIVGALTGNALQTATMSSGGADEDDDNDDDNDDTLSGGAGSIQNADYVSGLNNEKVGEDEEDVAVVGLEIEADDNSDIMITALTLNFSQETANDDFDDYAAEVAISLDGEVYARVDADRFEDDDSFDETVSLSTGAIVRAGETEDLLVHVTGINNLDSADAGGTWKIEIESIRFRDAMGAVITDSNINDGAGRTFSFETFATAADAEMKVSLADNNPDSMIVEVDQSNDTDGVELLVFEIEAEGDSDLFLDDFPITLTPSGANSPQLTEIANTVYLTIDGEEFSENLTSTSASAATITFDDLNGFEVRAGDTVEVVVSVDVNDLQGDFAEGDTLKAEFTASNRAMVDVEDESGEDLSSSERSGTALGDEMSFYETGLFVTLVDTDADTLVDDGQDDDSGVFTIEFDVEAFGGDVYVSTTAVATTASTIGGVAINDLLYRVTDSGTATTDDLSQSIDWSEKKGSVTSATGGNIKLTEGSIATLTLTVQQTNDSPEDDGLYQMFIEAIAWNIDDGASAGDYEIYDFDLDDTFKTATISLN